MRKGSPLLPAREDLAAGSVPGKLKDETYRIYFTAEEVNAEYLKRLQYALMSPRNPQLQSLALVLDDPSRFLHEGDHAIEEIYEVPAVVPHPEPERPSASEVN